MDYLRSFFVSNQTLLIEKIYLGLREKYNVELVVEEVMKFYNNIKGDLDKNEINVLIFKDNGLGITKRNGDEVNYVTEKNYSRVILYDTFKRLNEEKIINIKEGVPSYKDKKIVFEIPKKLNSE